MLSRRHVTKKMYLSCKGLTAKEAAAKLGCTTDTIYGAPKRFGVKKVIQELNKQRLTTHYLRKNHGKKTILEMANDMGTSTNAVYLAIKTLGLAPLYNISPKAYKPNPKEDFVYTEDKMYDCMYGCNTQVKVTQAIGARGIRVACSTCKTRVSSGGHAYYKPAGEEAYE